MQKDHRQLRTYLTVSSEKEHLVIDSWFTYVPWNRLNPWTKVNIMRRAGL